MKQQYLAAVEKIRGLEWCQLSVISSEDAYMMESPQIKIYDVLYLELSN